MRRGVYPARRRELDADHLTNLYGTSSLGWRTAIFMRRTLRLEAGRGRLLSRRRSVGDRTTIAGEHTRSLHPRTHILWSCTLILEDKGVITGLSDVALRQRTVLADWRGMPTLRAHLPYKLRRHGGRYLPAPKHRKRRNLVKFIPEADRDFAYTAGSFLNKIERDPARCRVEPDAIAEIGRAVREFREALAVSLHKDTRTQETTRLKRTARERCEEVIRRCANVIRADPGVDELMKIALRLRPRRKTADRRSCPQDPPVLTFLGAGDGLAYEAGVGNGSGVHVLRVEACERPRDLFRGQPMYRKAKPDGASRVEVFVDLVPQGEAIPRHPAELTGRPWYLGSFTTSRIEVKYPIPSEPMLVVYWARWADARGGVSRFSSTCAGRVEGWTQNAHPALPADGQSAPAKEKIVYVQVERLGPPVPHAPPALPQATQRPALEDHSWRALATVEVCRVPERVHDDANGRHTA